MIDMNKLKPIIEPLLNDENAVDVIEQIQAIDEPGVTQSDIDNLNKQWSERFRKAFFNGETTDEAGAPVAENNDPAEEVEEEPQKYEDLFSEEVKEEE